MSEKKGFIRRYFHFVGKIVNVIRHLISLLFLVFFLVIIGGMFAGDIQPIPDKGALYLAPSGVLVDQRSYVDPFTQASPRLTSEPQKPWSGI